MDILEVIEAGGLTTIQDRGRYGYQRYGVAASGALDQWAIRAANLLVGNREGDAALEVTFSGAQLRFLTGTLVSVTGADLAPRLDGKDVPGWEAVPVADGDVLAFSQLRQGMRAYLAIAGGIDVPLVLGSRSTYTRSGLGGLEGRPLRSGDVLSGVPPGPKPRGKTMPRSSIPAYGHSHELRVVMGPQAEAFTSEGVETFLSSTYTVTNLSDRTGYRLEGPTIEHTAGADIISDGIPLGAVQITGDGMPIVLLTDRGTTGGYTKIATVISTDIPELAQAVPGDTVAFSSITVEQAHEALREREELLDDLRSAPYTEYASNHYRARVEGAEHQAVTRLRKVAPGMPATTRSPLRRTVHVSIEGETYSFDVEVEDTSLGEGP